jgi:hypothetical protein
MTWSLFIQIFFGCLSGHFIWLGLKALWGRCAGHSRAAKAMLLKEHTDAINARYFPPK